MQGKGMLPSIGCRGRGRSCRHSRVLLTMCTWEVRCQMPVSRLALAGRRLVYAVGALQVPRLMTRHTCPGTHHAHCYCTRASHDYVAADQQDSSVQLYTTTGARLRRSVYLCLGKSIVCSAGT